MTHIFYHLSSICFHNHSSLLKMQLMLHTIKDRNRVCSFCSIRNMHWSWWISWWERHLSSNDSASHSTNIIKHSSYYFIVSYSLPFLSLFLMFKPFIFRFWKGMDALASCSAMECCSMNLFWEVDPLR